MKIKLIFLFIVFYLLSLLSTLPADKLARFIPADTGISLAAVSGSLWQGQAGQLNYKKQFQLQHIDWEIDWFALARLQLKVHIAFNNGVNALSGKGALIFAFSGIALENFILDSSAAELLAYIDLPVPLQLEGDLSLIIKEAAQGDPYCRVLDGYLLWKDAAINSEMGSVDLNSARIDLSCDQGQLVGDLQQSSEELTTTANVRLKEQRAYQLRGLLKAGEQLDPAIKDALSWIGRKNQSGETVLVLNGRL